MPFSLAVEPFKGKRGVENSPNRSYFPPASPTRPAAQRKRKGSTFIPAAAAALCCMQLRSKKYCTKHHHKKKHNTKHMAPRLRRGHNTTTARVWSLSYPQILPEERCSPALVGVAVALRFFHVHAELVLLVAAHVGVAHEVQRVVVRPRGRGHEIQLHLGSEEGRARVGAAGGKRWPWGWPG